jgi:hypothetical protein
MHVTAFQKMVVQSPSSTQLSGSNERITASILDYMQRGAGIVVTQHGKV